MKPFVFCAALVLSSASAAVAFAEGPAPDAAPASLETLPPPPAPATAPAPRPADPDRAETSTTAAASTRLEAIVGKTQALGFAVGVRAGRRMANNVYVGGTAMVQTGVSGGIVTYPALELGYDAKLGEARFMPYVGAGPMIGIPTETDAPVRVDPLVYPGFAFRYESETSPLVAGADVRILYFTDTDVAAIALNLTAGVRF